MIADVSIYLNQCAQAFAQATQQQPLIEHTVQISGVTFRLRFAGPALEPAVLPALAHLESTDTSDPTVILHLWDTVSTSVPLPQPPFTAADYHRYGQRALADDGRFAIMHAPTVPVLFAYDRATQHGLFWTADANALSIYERAAPMQTLFHWALSEFGWQIVHAAAVGTARGGVLLIWSIYAFTTRPSSASATGC